MGVLCFLDSASESSGWTADISGWQRQDELAVGEDLFREPCSRRPHPERSQQGDHYLR
jgi:hypothetical protein